MKKMIKSVYTILLALCMSLPSFRVTAEDIPLVEMGLSEAESQNGDIATATDSPLDIVSTDAGIDILYDSTVECSEGTEGMIPPTEYDLVTPNEGTDIENGHHADINTTGMTGTTDTTDMTGTEEATTGGPLSLDMGYDESVDVSLVQDLGYIDTISSTEVYVVKEKVDISSLFTSREVSSYKILDKDKGYASVTSRGGIITLLKTKKKTSPTTVHVRGLNYKGKEVERLDVMFIKPTLKFSNKKGKITVKGGSLNANDYLKTMGADVKVYRWKSSNPDIADINPSTGEITVKKKGKVKITAIFKATYGTKTSKVSAKLQVKMDSFASGSAVVQVGETAVISFYCKKGADPTFSLENSKVAHILKETHAGPKKWTVTVMGDETGKTKLYAELGNGVKTETSVYVEDKCKIHTFAIKGNAYPVRGMYMTKLADEIRAQANKKRASLGLPELIEDEILDKAAAVHAASYAYSYDTFGQGTYAKLCLDEAGATYGMYAVSRNRSLTDLTLEQLYKLSGSDLFSQLASNETQKELLANGKFTKCAPCVFAKYDGEVFDVYAIIYYTT